MVRLRVSVLSHYCVGWCRGCYVDTLSGNVFVLFGGFVLGVSKFKWKPGNKLINFVLVNGKRMAGFVFLPFLLLPMK